ncbi:hypothetical protein NUM3379_05020 [Kineococcus sp. NUM-3379]
MSAPRPSRDGGFSAVELVVGMAVSGALLVMVATLLLGTLRTTAFVSAKQSSAADARIAVSTMTQTLRVAEPLAPADASGRIPQATPDGQVEQALTVATPSTITFYASLATSDADPRPTRVTYGWNTGRRCLQETTVPAGEVVSGSVKYWTFPTASARTRCLAFGDTANANLFSYFTMPEPLDATASQGLVEPVALGAPGATLGLADLQDVDHVGVRLVLRSAAAVSTVDSHVTLVNALDQGRRS